MALRAKIDELSGWLQRTITPGLPYSQTVFEQRLGPYARASTRWLDLGCGHRMLPEWRAESEAQLVASAPVVVGLDADYPALKRHRSIRFLTAGDITQLPFKNESFDLVTANMVVEHLSDPAKQFAEVGRVLSPGGIFLFHTPNVRSYIISLARLFPDSFKQALAKLMEGRDAVDVYPTFYRANEAESIAAVAASSGFSVANIEFVASSPAFGLIAPLLVAELLWIRELRSRESLAPLRHTLICALRRN
jgi:SAM-dependent methyltransferase